ncbi:hypothetical protein BX666DRAFT_2120621 [Dichotomocladium elegans]|nr:hypothetical protein BX666DRAFT_2120621 [Dichotomocladium elegans]
MSFGDQRQGVYRTALNGALVAAVAGGTIGATVGILRNAPVKQYTLSTSLNCSFFTATFLIIRDTFSSHQRRKDSTFGLKDSQTRDREDLVSSTLAGATTGGLLSAVYRGPRGVLPGAVMFGLLCGTLQAALTAGNRWRQDAILNRNVAVESIASSEKPKMRISEYFHMPSWVPIRMMTDDEFEHMLDTRLKTLEDELRDIELEIQKKNR